MRCMFILLRTAKRDRVLIALFQGCLISFKTLIYHKMSLTMLATVRKKQLHSLYLKQIIKNKPLILVQKKKFP